ncbi:MAG: NAD(P)H-binding protein [Candidatus Limivicinus sp.]|nr:NAD(P)H-binding protein [Clostridiales bacterium]MDY3860589.1 NAD(P)H-binding protein [Candidatus Limivicinus sp.]
MIAITGLTGHSGRFFLQQLVDGNYTGALRCLVRAGSDTRRIDASGLNIEKFVGSIDSDDDLERFVSGADTVVHIAGIWKTPRLLAAVERAGGVRHVVLVHTSGIYSKHKMASQVYKDIEADMQQYLDRGMNVTIVRPTMIFGDLCDHNISKFIRMVDKLPVMPEIDHGAGLIQPVNARDLGQAYYKAAMHETLPQLDYICSGERPLSVHELCVLIGEYLGKKTRFISVPMSAGVLMARVLKAVTFGKKDYVEKVLRLGEDRSFSHEPARRDFGYEPDSFNAGLKREVEEYMKHGN